MTPSRRGTFTGLLAWGTIALAPVLAAEDPIVRFIQQQRIEETDKGSEDQFGTSVALWGDTALVGTPGDDGSGSAAGAAYVFTRDTNGRWQQGQKLTASGGTAGDLFGSAITLRDQVAVVGARSDHTQGNFAGAAYIFVRDEQGVWNEVQKLVASDGAAGHLFGFSVALGDGFIVIGARGNEDRNDFTGEVYVFRQDANGLWAEVQKLTASDAAVGDSFGASVTVSGETILVGAPGRDDRGSAAGAAYLFTLEGSGQWREWHKLTASDGAAGDEFGYSVALSEQGALVGARFATGEEDHDKDGEKDRIGAAYAFAYGVSHIGTQWSEAQKLLPSEEETSQEFGSSLAIYEKTALVGVRRDREKGDAAGAVFVFTFMTDAQGAQQWREQQKMTARDAVAGDEFGASVALFGKIAVIGAPFDDLFVEGEEEDEDDDDVDDETFTNVGSAYIVVTTESPDSCAIRTDYANAQCRGTVEVASLADLDEYIGLCPRIPVTGRE